MRIKLHSGLYRGVDDGGSGSAGATAQANGSTPPPANGSTPPPANGSTPPPANGSTPPPANGSTPPQAGFDWKGLSLPPELQNVVDRHQFKDPATVIQSYDNLEKLRGVPPDRLLKIPQDGDPPEAWKEFKTKLGVPETADGYNLPLPKGDSGEFAKVAQNWFHEANVPAGAAAKLAEKWNTHVEQTRQAQQQAVEAKNTTELTELQRAWGANYEKNAALVDRAAEEFGISKQQLDGLKQTMGLKSTMELLHNIGIKIGTEGEFIAPDKGGNTGDFSAMSPEQARAEINRLKNDTAFRQLYSSNDPQARTDARAKMARLAKIAAPGFTVHDGPKR